MPKSRGSHRDRIFGPPVSKYLWCLHCQRTYESGKWRTIRRLQRCPYLDCDGDAVLDALDWAEVRKSHAEYPNEPRWGAVYEWELPANPDGEM
jgi:hypothetical protein